MEQYDFDDLGDDIQEYNQVSDKVKQLQADNAALRQRLARLVEAAKHYIITPDADEITKRLALHDLRVCISGVEDDK